MIREADANETSGEDGLALPGSLVGESQSLNQRPHFPKAENEAITFGDIRVSTPKQIANYFNRQFTTSKLGRHNSSREIQIVSREIKRKSLMSAVTFTTDQVIKGISNCSNTKAFGPDKLSIFHLKNLGPRAIEYLTALFNDSVTSCRIPTI